MVDDAVGIPNKSDYGNVHKLKAGRLYDFIVQQHNSKIPHKDIRIGNRETNLFSFATQKGIPKEHNEKITLYQQPLHSYEYKDFEGEIPKGQYGAGSVSKYLESKVLITNVKPDHISFTLADKQKPERYSMVQMKNKKEWLLIKHDNPSATGVEKPKFISIDKDDIFHRIENLKPGDVVQPKIDGSLALIALNKNRRIEVLSHRISKKDNQPIIHSERVLGKRYYTPNTEHRDTVLLGETYGIKNDKVIHPSELSGILNSSIAKSRETQSDKNIQLKTMLFDIAKYKGKKLDIPYDERLEKLKEIIKSLPKDKFELPEYTSDKKEALSILKNILNKKHFKTTEGIVIHSGNNKSVKFKTNEEYNVYIRDIFPGEGKYKNNAAGGFRYSHSLNGSIIGNVGTGLDDATRKDMHENPKNYIGRIARVSALEKNKNGVLQKPSFISIAD